MKAPSHTQIEIQDALIRCREVAEAEYRIADDALGGAEATANFLLERVDTLLQELPSKPGRDSGMAGVIKKVGEELRHKVENQILGSRKKLNAKRPRLRKFTIALFGRTMAGKSTIREAITGGDGGSIGKGGQNTTKRIHEYEWQGVHIIDTPGIGSFKGEHYRQQAIAAVEKSDLVLFLLTEDGIQPEVFQGMKDVLIENKPMLFVLNVKRDLKKDIYRERFLYDPESLFGSKRIDGHFKAIQRSAKGTLGCKNPRVIAIHAQAAHLATQKHPQGDALYHASRMEELHRVICDEVATNGPIRRLQTLLDGTIGAVDSLIAFYDTHSAMLKNEATFFQRRQKDFESRASQLLRDQKLLITKHASECLQGLHDQVFDFIEDNIERKDIGQLWQKRVAAARIEDNLKDVQNQVADAAKTFVAEFTYEISIDSEFQTNFNTAGDPKRADTWDLRRGFGRTAAVAGVLSAAAGLGNPVGWSLLAVSVVSGIAAWFVSKKTDRLATEKTKARSQLHKQIHDQELKVRKGFLKWLREEVGKKALGGISRDLGLALKSLKTLNSALQTAGRSSCLQVDRLNSRLLLRLAEITQTPIESLVLKSLARTRGLVFRALCKKGTGNVAVSKIATACLAEDVTLVEDGSAEQIIRESLHPLKPKRLQPIGRGFVVHLTCQQMQSLGRRADALFDATRRIAKVPTKYKITG